MPGSPPTPGGGDEGGSEENAGCPQFADNPGTHGQAPD